MTKNFIGERITELRMQRNVSECQMSLELGQSKSYVQSVTSGRSMPSVHQLFNIADYFDISLSEFFDEGNHDSAAVREALTLLRELSEADVAAVLAVLRQLKNRA